MVTIFVSHSFPCFKDLKLDNTITMVTVIVSFDLDLRNLSEKFNFVDFQHGKPMLKPLHPKSLVGIGLNDIRWSNLLPKLFAYVGLLHKVANEIGCLRNMFNCARKT